MSSLKSAPCTFRTKDGPVSFRVRPYELKTFFDGLHFVGHDAETKTVIERNEHIIHTKSWFINHCIHEWMLNGLREMEDYFIKESAEIFANANQSYTPLRKFCDRLYIDDLRIAAATAYLATIEKFPETHPIGYLHKQAIRQALLHPRALRTIQSGRYRWLNPAIRDLLAWSLFAVVHKRHYRTNNQNS